MASVTLKNAAKRFGDTRVLHDIDLDIESGEFVVMVGPSGCGKSTLLRIIAGLETLSEGTLEIDGQLVNDVPPASRGTAMVFQSYALYPHWTVRRNMAFALRLAKLPPEEIDARVERAATFLQLEPYLDRLPKALSGGQRQRVAIGRAIVRSPKVFLFDEPLSNLDAALRVATRLKLAELKQSLPDTTMVYVTHDQVEAMTLADRIVVLSADGGIEQVGPPIELYRRPSNLFVARFIGSPAMNILPATLVAAGHPSRVRLTDRSEFDLPVATGEHLRGQQVQFGIRPEHLRISEPQDGIVEGRVAWVESLGDQTLLYLDIGLEATAELDREDRLLVLKVPGLVEHDQGALLRVAADLGEAHLFALDGTRVSRAPDPNAT